MKRHNKSTHEVQNSVSNSYKNEEEDLGFESSDEGEQDCEEWDTDTVTVAHFPSGNQVIGYHLMPTCTRDPDIHPKKKIKIFPQMREDLQQKTFFGELKQKWLNNESCVQNGVEFIREPFKVCVIEKFLSNTTLLNDVLKEFNELKWNHRSMDLYEFCQSEDLKYIKSDNIRKVYEFLKTDVMTWVANLMNLDLRVTSASCSLYTNTDYLLIHDDQHEDRLVAFVLYLTDEDGWNSDKGGALQLLSSDKDGYPVHVVRDILPANNQLVLFPVTSNSHHQVAEITTRESCRMSINGWFHTKVAPVFDAPTSIIPTEGLFSDKIYRPQKIEIDLHSWIHEDYLDPEIFSIINEQIEDNSEICLKSFLREEPYTELIKVLSSSEMTWKRIGPPYKFCYDVIDYDQLPYILERFLSLFQSEEMFSLLKEYTELELNSQEASMKFEFQRWQPGYYALLTDYDWESKNELDLIMYFGVTNKNDIVGGRTQYVTMEDEVQTALITIEPEDNNLNIVYRDTARFTKYISKQSRCKCFYTLVCSYSE